MNIHSRLSYHARPAFLKLVLKNNCMCNRDNAHDVDILPDEKITTRSEPANQAKTKTNIAKGLKIYLNDLKNYLRIRLVIVKILGKYWYILNNIRLIQIFNSWTSVIHLIPGNTCHWISKHKWKKSNEIFFEKYILVKTFSSDN